MQILPMIMTKHDTWVKLKPGNPYEKIMVLFPSGMIPMRDPFPLERAAGEFQNEALWIIDLERLNSLQVSALTQILATHYKVEFRQVAQEAAEKGGFAVRQEWIESMMGGAESMQRTKELADWLETAPQPPSETAWMEFYNDQHARWIEGDEVPPPISSIEDIDSRLHTPELAEAMKRNEVNRMLANYSVFDVLSGRAMVEILNQQNPDQNWSLVGYGDDDEDDEDWYE